MVGLVTLLKETLKSLLSPFLPLSVSLSLSLPCEDTAGRQLSTIQEESSHQKLTMLAP